MTNDFLTDLIHHLYTNQQSIFAVYSRNLLLIGLRLQISATEIVHNEIHFGLYGHTDVSVNNLRHKM